MKLSILGMATAAVTMVGSMTHAGETLDRITEGGVLKVATEANWAPQSFLNDDNEMDGFDVDVAKEIGKRLNAEVEFITPSWDIITAGNWNGRWDLSVGSMTPTKARAEVLDFPATYYFTPAAVAVHADSAASNAGDLNDKRVGVCASCTYELYLQKDLEIDAVGAPEFEYIIDAGEIRSYPTSAPVFDDLRLGDGVRLDGLIDSMPAILNAIENGYPLKVIGTPVFYEPLAVATDKGDAEFNEAIAQAVSDMRDDGTLTRLSEKWYGVDYTTTN